MELRDKNAFQGQFTDKLKRDLEKNGFHGRSFLKLTI